MAEPMKRSRALSDLLKDSFGASPEGMIKQNKCVRCGKDAKQFDNEISKREYRISGFCQICQNWIFRPLEDSE